MAQPASPASRLADPVYNLGTAALLKAFTILGELSQKSWRLFFPSSQRSREVLSSPPPAPPPPTPAQTPHRARATPEVVDRSPFAIPTPPTIARPIRNPIKAALNDCITGNFQTRGAEDPEANLNFLDDLTFRRICTDIPEKNEDRWGPGLLRAPLSLRLRHEPFHSA